MNHRSIHGDITRPNFSHDHRSEGPEIEISQNVNTRQCFAMTFGLFSVSSAFENDLFAYRQRRCIIHERNIYILYDNVSYRRVCLELIMWRMMNCCHVDVRVLRKTSENTAITRRRISSWSMNLSVEFFKSFNVSNWIDDEILRRTSL